MIRKAQAASADLSNHQWAAETVMVHQLGPWVRAFKLPNRKDAFSSL